MPRPLHTSGALPQVPLRRAQQGNRVNIGVAVLWPIPVQRLERQIPWRPSCQGRDAVEFYTEKKV